MARLGRAHHTPETTTARSLDMAMPNHNGKRSQDDTPVSDSNDSGDDEDIPARVSPAANVLRNGNMDARAEDDLDTEDDGMKVDTIPSQRALAEQEDDQECETPEVIEALNSTLCLSFEQQQHKTVDSMTIDLKDNSLMTKTRERENIMEKRKLRRPKTVHTDLSTMPRSSTARRLQPKKRLNLREQYATDSARGHVIQRDENSGIGPMARKAPQRFERKHAAKTKKSRPENIIQAGTQIRSASQNTIGVDVDRDPNTVLGSPPRESMVWGDVNESSGVESPDEHGSSHDKSTAETADTAEQVRHTDTSNVETPCSQLRTRRIFEIVEGLEAKLGELIMQMELLGPEGNPGLAATPVVFAREAKLMLRTLEDLQSTYEDAEKITSANSCATRGEKDEALHKLFQEYFGIVNSIISDRLCIPNDEHKEKSTTKIQRMLKDLYLRIFPEIVKVLRVAVKIHTKHRSILPGALQEVTELAKSLHRLVENAISLPKELQPHQMKLRRPIRSFAPLIRSFVRYCEKSLPDLRKAVRIAELRLTAPERVRKWKEELAMKQQREDAEYLQRIKERSQISRARKRANDEFLLSPTQLSEWKKSHVDSMKIVGRKRRRSPNEEEEHTPASREYEMFVEDEDPFADSQLHLSIKDAASNALKQRPWTRSEMEIMVDGLQQNQGPDRYEIIFDRLDRSLNEIITWAKHFRATMEDDYSQRQHQNPRRLLPRLESWIRNIV